MKIAVPRERIPGERRVALVPDTVAKFVKLGLTVAVEHDGRRYVRDPERVVHGWTSQRTRIRHAFRREERLDDGRDLGRIDPEKGDVLGSEFAIRANHIGRLRAARWTPGRPEIYDEDFAGEIGAADLPLALEATR